MKQHTILIAKDSFTIKTPGTRGKPCTVKPDDRFWVTTPIYRNIETVLIQRVEKGYIGTGYCINIAELNSHFEVLHES